MFPGQGAQRRGMWDAFAGGESLMQEASYLLDDDLIGRCGAIPPADWPCDLLQPAMFTVAVAASRHARATGAQPVAVVGHSLGEYAALVAAGCLSFPAALRVVRVRGEAMDAAGAAAPGGMTAIVGLDCEAVSAVCAAIGDVWVANENSPQQLVISGRLAALDLADEECRRLGAKAAIRLDVPVANHTPLMEPAIEPVRRALSEETLRAPECELYSGVDAAAHDEPAEIATLLARALSAPVLFAATVRSMVATGISTFVELGPGKALCRLVRQTHPAASCGTLVAPTTI
jgi:[acyl-carrier-protein] S-malonyltransferase